jgi:hypothetical protein
VLIEAAPQNFATFPHAAQEKCFNLAVQFWLMLKHEEESNASNSVPAIHFQAFEDACWKIATELRESKARRKVERIA